MVTTTTRAINTTIKGRYPMSEQPTLTEPATPGTGADVIEFLDRAAERGWINPGSAQALRTATIKILSIDEDWERIDLRELDLDEQFDRFQTLKRNDYSDGSLKNYKSRFNQAVAMYRARLRGESDWKSYGPAARVGGSSRNGKSAASKSTKKVPEPGQKIDVAPPPLSGPQDSGAPSRRFIEHTFPLVDDDAVLRLPRHLTAEEARWLADFLQTLVRGPATESRTASDAS
jgi:hypothetical protein